MTFSLKNGLFINTPVAKPAYVKAPLDQQVQKFFDSNGFDKAEDLIMHHLEQSPADLDFFVPVIRALLRRKHAELAETVLQFVLDARQDRDDPEADIAFLSTVLEFWPGHRTIREALLAHLHTRYGGCPNFDRFAGHFNVLGSEEGIPLFARLEQWLRFDEGRVVHMATKGVGRVREINLVLGVVRVAFAGPGAENMTFRIDEAQRLLEPLPAGHFLVERLERPEPLRKLADESPGDLLARVFASVKGPVTIIELKELLYGIVAETGWPAWWTRARQDRRLTVGQGTRAVCTWSESAAAADSDITSRFHDAPAREKLELWRKHGNRSAELAAAMGTELLSTARRIADAEPSLAMEIVLGLDTTAQEAQTVLAQILGRDHPADVIAGVQNRQLRRKAVELVKKQRDDWPVTYAALLAAEPDTSIIQLLFESLKTSAYAGLDDLVQGVLANPGRAPKFYLWLCREMADHPEIKPADGWEFVRRLLDAIDDAGQKSLHATLRKLFDRGEAGFVTACGLTLEQTRELLRRIDRGGILEEYRRDALRSALLDAHAELREKKEFVYVTAESLQKKREELDRLVKEEIPRNSLEIKRAREHGDLKENFEYKAARARHELLSSQAKTLYDGLAVARAIDPAAIGTSAVTVGARVRLKPAPDDGAEVIVTILGPWDSDPANHIVSYLAPSVSAILGAKVGDTVTYDGCQFLVAGIEAWKTA